MDSGAQQEEMAEEIKRQVKENAHRRRWERVVNGSSNHIAGSNNDNKTSFSKNTSMLVGDQSPLLADSMDISANSTGTVSRDPNATTNISYQPRSECVFSLNKEIPFSRSDNIFIMFYLENLVPFLFPFYRPSTLEGGRAWILEMMISSPVARQATLCQSSYFFSLTRNAFDRAHICETVAMKTREAFEILRRAIQVILDSDIKDHVHGAARIMASIMQLQRYEIAILSFENCQLHINASLAIFNQLLEHVGHVQDFGPSSSFNTIMNSLGPPSYITPTQTVAVPSTEQAAFRFASTLLILDDIVSSTVLQEEPRLYSYHQCLLGVSNTGESTIDLESVMGCQNWVLLEISETAALDAWKQRCKNAGDLDVISVVHRATIIKTSLETQLIRLESNRGTDRSEEKGLFDFLTIERNPAASPSSYQTADVTRVWAHAALIYLSVVTSGCQPANSEVQYHVDKVIEILTREISPPSLLRTMVWPFCVAGCLSAPQKEGRFRELAERLQPISAFGTVQRALEIMENVWRNRFSESTKGYDLSAWFRGLGDSILLV